MMMFKITRSVCRVVRWKCSMRRAMELGGRITFVLTLLLCREVLTTSLSVADERRPSRAGDDLFPALDDLPPLSGSSNSEPTSRSPRLDADPQNSSPSRGRTPRSSRNNGLDESIPLEGKTLDPLDEERSPFRKRSSPGLTEREYFPPLLDDAERSALPMTGNASVTNSGFDWTLQPVSVADIEIGKDWQFEHGKPNLTEAEEDSYVSLIRAVMDRQTLAPGEVSESTKVKSAWETAFYRFAEVRRQAWQNGKLKLQLKTTDHNDPFARGESKLLSSTDHEFDVKELTKYSLQVDMQSHPSDFVGRPVVIYGMFTPLGPKELQARRTLEGEERLFTLQRGILKNLRNTQTLAMVDAISYIDPQSQNRPSTAWPVEKRVAIPVMIKGWFVKLWQQQPLIFTDVARVLTPRPYDEYVREHVRSRRKVNDDESWLYHETLRQLQLTSSDVQAAIALEEQKSRVKHLLIEVKEKAAADLLVLKNQLQSGSIAPSDSGKTEGYETRRKRLERQLSVRENRYLQFQQDPEAFPLFVDVFQNPDHWQGRLVTFRGHVRRVLTYNGDSTLFDGQPLHELWLFTDDSQQNPAVIVTPSLPRDFPVGSDLIDSVTVTGCFFKMYVYRSQQENRLAPLVLAGHVSWNPSADHVLALAKEGHLPANSKLLAEARNQGRSVSDTMVLVLGFLSLLFAMTVWGRVQRDRREQQRLMALVDERPDFRQTSQDLFTGPFADSRIEPTRG